jgi:GTP-binding protein HflX
LVHVVDGSAANPEEQIRAVHHVLSEIEREEIPELLVFNKTDRLNEDGERALQALESRYPGSVRASALTGDGVTTVVEAIAARLRAMQKTVDVLLPFERGDLLAMLHREAEVLTEVAEETGMQVRVRLDDATLASVSEFVVKNS